MFWTGFKCGVSVVAVALVLLLGSGCPIAPTPKPIQYNINGTITQITDNAGAAAIAGLKVGDSVAYTIVIDLNLNAFIIDNTNTKFTLTDNQPFGNFIAGLNYSLANLISGDPMDEVAGGSHNGANEVKEFHLCAVGDPTFPTQVILGSNDDTIIIVHKTKAVGAWAVAQQVDIAHEAFNAAGQKTSVFIQNATITGIVPL
ncbi:MAG: hypothetical protein AMXMBFR84_48450 [Candidatus Hydrogenedentota bacterium]